MNSKTIKLKTTGLKSPLPPDCYKITVIEYEICGIKNKVTSENWQSPEEKPFRVGEKFIYWSAKGRVQANLTYLPYSNSNFVKFIQKIL
jgi:hypothetical protein